MSDDIQPDATSRSSEPAGAASGEPTSAVPVSATEIAAAMRHITEPVSGEGSAGARADATAGPMPDLGAVRDDEARPEGNAAISAEREGPGPAAAAASDPAEAARDPASAPAAPYVAPELTEAAPREATLDGFELLDDVELEVKVELGRTEMLIEDVLRLSVGSVVELDKLAGDPVDIFVNARLVAHGEVLVLNDNFCVRINDIVSPVPELAQNA